LGHSAGDAMLMEIAVRLRACTRAGDTLFVHQPLLSARMGGDEFAVILRNLESEAQAVQIAARIVEHVRAPMAIAGQQMQVSASIGISMLGECLSAEEVV